MGTRSLTHVFDDRGADGDERPLVTIYRQFDGYPSGMGEDLAAILRGRRIVNGIGSGDTDDTASNGMGCLAATIVSRLKEGIGGVYLYPAGSSDVGEEYVYSITHDPTLAGRFSSPLRLTVRDVYADRVIFDGSPDAFDAKQIAGVEA